MKGRDLTDMRFGRLVALRQLPKTIKYRRCWECVCDCGQATVVTATILVARQKISCGCAVVDHARSLNRTHGKSHARSYYIWRGIQERCRGNGPPQQRRRYFERGIRLCERWQKYENFIEDMGEPPDGLSIDRIDNDGNYEPGNCRWATRTEQARNRRTTVWITHQGETMLAQDWAARLGWSRSAVCERLQRLPITEALTPNPKRIAAIEAHRCDGSAVQ